MTNSTFKKEFDDRIFRAIKNGKGFEVGCIDYGKEHRAFYSIEEVAEYLNKGIWIREEV